MGFFSNLFSSGFNDPKPMDNHTLIGSIAGQADWLEKMIRSPYETQKTQSIIDIVTKRRAYLVDLCMEVIARGLSDSGEGPMYPGATKAINVFEETAEYFKSLESQGISKEAASVRAVKEILFKGNGVHYMADWEASK